MSQQKLMVIINPISGTGSKRGFKEMIAEHLEADGFDVDVQLTTCAGDATRLAALAVEKDYYGVVAVGGDGTVNETARALCGSRVALGIVPAGSGNGLARHIGIPMDVKSALRIIARRAVRPCDYATANGHPFFCTFGVGFDAAVTHRFSNSGTRGLLTYLTSAVTEFVSYREEHYHIEADGRKAFELEAFVVACCNASQYGNNAMIAPYASITDGLLDLTIIHKGNPLTKMLVGAELMTGLIMKNAMIDTLQVKNAVITRHSDGPAHIDGEPVNMPARIEVKTHAGQLNVFTNDRKLRTLPPIDLMIKPWIEIGAKVRSALA